MIRKLAIACVALVAFAGAACAEMLPALDPPHPKLKAEAVVTGDIVRIGDLVDNAGIVANVPIFRSPDLGSTGTVPAETVVEAVRAHQLIGLDTNGVDNVVVTRATRTISPGTIENAVTAALSNQYALGPTKDLVLTFDRTLTPQHVEPTATGMPRVLRLGYDVPTGHFNAAVEIPGRAPLLVSGQARAMVEVLTIAHTVNRGEILKQADVMFERRSRGEVGRDFIVDATQAVGMAARFNMQPGHLLRGLDLTRPEVIRRNESVTLIYQIPGITLTVRGKATEGGAVGDMIGVLNEQSKRVLQGVVAGPGRVVIGTAGGLLAANNPPVTTGSIATEQ